MLNTNPQDRPGILALEQQDALNAVREELAALAFLIGDSELPHRDGLWRFLARWRDMLDGIAEDQEKRFALLKDREGQA